MLLVVLLMVLSVLFGGFQKGTKVNGLGSLCSSCTTAPVMTAHWWAPGRSAETGSLPVGNKMCHSPRCERY